MPRSGSVFKQFCTMRLHRPVFALVCADKGRVKKAEAQNAATNRSFGIIISRVAPPICKVGQILPQSQPKGRRFSEKLFAAMLPPAAGAAPRIRRGRYPPAGWRARHRRWSCCRHPGSSASPDGRVSALRGAGAGSSGWRAARSSAIPRTRSGPRQRARPASVWA